MMAPHNFSFDETTDKEIVRRGEALVKACYTHSVAEDIRG
jgi:hypothetical protein